MPLEASYKESIKGSLTDLKNIGAKAGGGSITAALFLQEFIEKTPWAHIGVYMIMTMMIMMMMMMMMIIFIF